MNRLKQCLRLRICICSCTLCATEFLEGYLLESIQGITFIIQFGSNLGRKALLQISRLNQSVNRNTDCRPKHCLGKGCHNYAWLSDTVTSRQRWPHATDLSVNRQPNRKARPTQAPRANKRTNGQADVTPVDHTTSAG